MEVGLVLDTVLLVVSTCVHHVEVDVTNVRNAKNTPLNSSYFAQTKPSLRQLLGGFFMPYTMRK